MASKIVYFMVGERKEQAEFRNDSPADDFKECFRSAAEAGPYDILKLYNYKGNLVNISTNLEGNSSETRYKLEVVAAHCGHCGKDLHGVDVEEIEKRLQYLERTVYTDHGNMPKEFLQLRTKVESFKDKLESVEHLSWLGLFKEIASGTSPIPVEKSGLRKSREHYTGVLEKFLRMGFAEPSLETLQELRHPTFDNWQWEDAEMLFLLQRMYNDLGLAQAFHIEDATLQQFLYEVYRHYNQIPFHNFRHCFCVTQMMYGMICQSEVHKSMEKHEILCMLTAALCHDLDHPGYNNQYQINAKTELAIRYNDISPLENHHSSVAFDILSRPQCNILANLKPEMYKMVRVGIIKSILATDMAQHATVLTDFKEILSQGFDFKNDAHRQMLMKIFIKAADVSNEARPMDVAEPWLECLLEESFNQSDLEKLEGLPVAPFMDRDKVTKPGAQIGFIQFILIPLFESLVELFPVFETALIKPIRSALEYYKSMATNTEEERKRRENKTSTPPRKTSFENTEQPPTESRLGERKNSATQNRAVGNGPLEHKAVRKSSSGCKETNERKQSKDKLSNGPIIVSTGLK